MKILKLRSWLLVGLTSVFLFTVFYWSYEKNRFLEISKAFLEAESIIVHADTPGKITEIGPSEGEHVKKNQSLFIVDHDFIFAKLSKAKKEVDELEKQIDKEKEKIGSAMDGYLMAAAEMELGIGSEEEVSKELHEMDLAQKTVDLSMKKLQDAKANLELLNLQLEKMTVLSPFDGVILKKTKNLGSVVSYGDPVLVLCDDQNIWIEAEILETDLSSISIGTQAKVRLTAYPKHELLGKISYIGGATVAKSSFSPNVSNIQTIPIKIALDSAPFPLKPGLSAHVQLKVR